MLFNMVSRLLMEQDEGESCTAALAKVEETAACL